MNREWKPGDHARGVVTTRGPDVRKLVRTNSPSYPWRVDDALGGHVAESVVRDIDSHPLVTIDLQDREQIERLSSLIFARIDTYGTGRVEATWAALRSLIEPPKPEEPTDPKTRVTDRRDNIWRLLADGDWVCTSGPDVGEYLNWDQLAGDRGPVSIEVAS